MKTYPEERDEQVVEDALTFVALLLATILAVTSFVVWLVHR